MHQAYYSRFQVHVVCDVVVRCRRSVALSNKGTNNTVRTHSKTITGALKVRGKEKVTRSGHLLTFWLLAYMLDKQSNRPALPARLARWCACACACARELAFSSGGSKRALVTLARRP